MELLSPSALVWLRIADRGWLIDFSVKGNWLAGITWKAWPLIKREGNRGWAAKWFVLSKHVPVSPPYRMALASPPQPSTAWGICYILLHSLLSLLIKKYLLHFSWSFPSHTETYGWRGNSRRGACAWINIYLIAANRSLLLSVTAEMARGKKDSFMRQSDKTGS